VSGPSTGPFVATLVWSQQNPNVIATSGYIVQMSTDSGGFNTITNIVGGANQSYSVGPLVNGHTYNFRVATIYNGVHTAYSGVGSITFPSGAEVAVPAQTLAGGIHAVAYSQQIHAGIFVTLPNGDMDLIQYGVPPYVWSVASGSLPTGLSLEANTGIVSGIPSTAGTYVFTIQAVDSAQPTPYTGVSPNLTIIIS
jgi:hypothetical protein